MSKTHFFENLLLFFLSFKIKLGPIPQNKEWVRVYASSHIYQLFVGNIPMAHLLLGFILELRNKEICLIHLNNIEIFFDIYDF